MGLNLKRGYSKLGTGLRFVREKVDRWYDKKIRQLYREWYNKEFYPFIGRRLDYYLSMDFKGIKEDFKENFKLRNIPKIIIHPSQFRDFLQRVEFKHAISQQRIEEKRRKRREEAPGKAVLYRRKSLELEKQLAEITSVFEKLKSDYSELNGSVRAAESRIAAGQFENYEASISELRAEKRVLESCLQEIGTKYGDCLQRISHSETELASSKKSNLKQHEELKKVREEDIQIEAIMENERRKYAKAAVESNKLISILRRGVHEKEERFVEGYLREVVDFVNRHPGALLIIGPGLEGKILEASKDAKEVLNYNGDLVGRPYSDILALDSRQKRQALIYFSKPEEQELIVPIVDRGRKKYNVKAANKPIMSRVPGEERHLLTVATVSSMGWWEKRYGSSKDADLRLVLEEEKKQAAEQKKTHEKIKQVMDEAKKELDKGMNNPSP